MEKVDGWLQGQEKYLKGVVLYWQSYKPSNPENDQIIVNFVEKNSWLEKNLKFYMMVTLQKIGIDGSARNVLMILKENSSGKLESLPKNRFKTDRFGRHLARRANHVPARRRSPNSIVSQHQYL